MEIEKAIIIFEIKSKVSSENKFERKIPYLGNLEQKFEKPIVILEISTLEFF